MKDHKYYQAAYRAYYNTSFSPEKRAESECNFFEEIKREFSEIQATEQEQSKFEKLFMINLLKSKGFKRSPRFGAWQRLLNANCLDAFNYYIKPKLA